MDLKSIITGTSLCFLASAGFSQKLLTLEESISIALENNYDIKLEKYNVEMNENNVSRAVSGQAPSLEINTSFEWGYAEAETQTLGLAPGEANNAPVELDGTSRDLLLQPQINLPIFEGFRGKYRFRQLKNTHRMSELQLTLVTEQTITRTVSAYLEVARLQSRIAIDEENIAISYDRWQRLVEDAKFGTTNSVRRLQAAVDLKTDSAHYRNTILVYENSRRNLNLVLAQPLDQVFTVQEDILLSNDLQYGRLEEEMQISNTRLNLSLMAINDVTYEVKISEASYFPRIQGYANYTYFDTEDDANFILSNTVQGPNVGITMRWPVFTSGANRIRRQNSQIKLDQQKTALNNISLNLERELSNAFAQYMNNKEQLRIEVSNLETFERNYSKTREDYALGLVDASDLRTAQLNLSSARNRINDLAYNVKQSEITLLQLSGRLTK